MIFNLKNLALTFFVSTPIFIILAIMFFGLYGSLRMSPMVLKVAIFLWVFTSILSYCVISLMEDYE